LTAESWSLASLVKKTKDKKAKAQLQSQLNDARARLAAAKDQLSKLEDATLRAETQGYLQKIYKVISVLNASHEPV
jgi:flagellar motor protein MotB